MIQLKISEDDDPKTPKGGSAWQLGTLKIEYLNESETYG